MFRSDPNFRDVETSWVSIALKAQIAHPLTPVDLEKLKREAGKAPTVGELTHSDKMAFRLSVPLIGKLLHTGGASFLVLNFVAGFLFFPMLAGLANRHLRDRVSSTYVTFAFALSYAGSRFFNDNMFGDGFAWACLLAAVYFRHPLLIFSCVLIAGFTDERAIFASAAVFLYWLGVATYDRQDGSQTRARAALAAVAAAWLAYIALRLSLSYAFGLKTGSSELFGDIPWKNAAQMMSYGLLAVFQGLWLWMVVGAIALYVNGRVAILLGSVATLGAVLAIALNVWDFQRSVGYAFLLLPVAWQAGSVEQGTVRALARSCFLLGVCFIVPFNTVLRYLYHGPVLVAFG